MEPTTIAAIATPAGAGGIGIIRVSGPHVPGIAQTLFQRSDPRHRQRPFHPISHRFYHGRIVVPESGQVVDEVLVVVMKAPRSYTREDVLEIQVHAGPAVMRTILDLVLRHGAVMAAPGEFTRRAFLNGRIDLTQAEAVIDIINAQADSALQVAAAQVQGALGAHIAAIRSVMREIIAQTEAAIDFPEDVGDEIDDARMVRRLKTDVVAPVEDLLHQYDAGHVLRDGLKVIVAGRPNVGKSSLMNRLLGRDRAIVTPVPGTTRDFIEESLVIQGIPVTLTDTAGLHATDDPVEKIGIERTMSRIASAGLVLLMTEAGRPPGEEDRAIFDITRDKPAIWVENKRDLQTTHGPAAVPEGWGHLPRVSISALYDQGIGELKRLIETEALAPSLACESAIIPNLRHRRLIEGAARALFRAVEGIRCRQPFELVNMDVRTAYDRLGEVVGITVREDILDEIFDRFCIGK